MPMYRVMCDSCGSSHVIFRKINERDCDMPQCLCFGIMRRIVEAPAVRADLPGYTSPIDGRWVEGRRARTEDLKRNGCRPWEGMESERKEATTRVADADRHFEKTIGEGIAEVYNGMSAEKQRALQAMAT